MTPYRPEPELPHDYWCKREGPQSAGHECICLDEPVALPKEVPPAPPSKPFDLVAVGSIGAAATVVGFATSRELYACITAVGLASLWHMVLMHLARKRP